MGHRHCGGDETEPPTPWLYAQAMQGQHVLRVLPVHMGRHSHAASTRDGVSFVFGERHAYWSEHDRWASSARVGCKKRCVFIENHPKPQIPSHRVRSARCQLRCSWHHHLRAGDVSATAIGGTRRTYLKRTRSECRCQSRRRSGAGTRAAAGTRSGAHRDACEPAQAPCPPSPVCAARRPASPPCRTGP